MATHCIRHLGRKSSLTGARVLARALKTPARQIVKDSGADRASPSIAFAAQVAATVSTQTGVSGKYKEEDSNGRTTIGP
jgi:hypothetical protein